MTSIRKITPRMRMRYGLQRKPLKKFALITTSDEVALDLERRALAAGWSVFDEMRGEEHRMTFKPPKRS